MRRSEIAKEHDFAESMHPLLREPITVTGPFIPASQHNHQVQTASNSPKLYMLPSLVSIGQGCEFSPKKRRTGPRPSSTLEEPEPESQTIALSMKKQSNAELLMSNASSSSSSETESMSSSIHSHSKSLTSQASSPSIFRTASIDSNEEYWTGVGRFQYHVDATPMFLKEKLENDTRAPGAFNFFGPNTKLGPHPLASSEDFTNPRDSLHYKFRTKSSTTISDDGCIIQKGFEVPLNSATSLASAEHISNLVAKTKGAKASQSSTDSNANATAKHPRRVTWDEHTINPKDSGVSGIATAINEQPGTWSEQRPFSAYTTPQPPREMIKKGLEIADEEDAENAIDSDDESDYEPVVRMRKLSPSKSVSPPKKSILKKTTSSVQATQAIATADYIAIKYHERFFRSSYHTMNYQQKRTFNGPARYGDSTRRFAPRTH